MITSRGYAALSAKPRELDGITPTYGSYSNNFVVDATKF